MQKLGLIVAVARGGVIGVSEGGHLGLPWHLPEDLKHFKRITKGHAIVMGRTTHEAIGRPLPKRLNVVLSRSGVRFEGCVTAASLDEGIEKARAWAAEDPERGQIPFVIGGASVYAEALPKITDVYLTEIDRDVDGDAYFHLDEAPFEERSRHEGETDGLVFRHLVRRQA